MPVPGYSIVISSINDNTKQLWECLESVEEHTAGTFEVILILSGDQPKSRLMAESFEFVEVITVDEKLHFAPAYNLGLRACTGRYRMVLNDDTLVSSGWNLRMMKSIADFQVVHEQMPPPAIVGPGSNYVGGVQLVQGSQNVPRQHFAEFWEQNYKGRKSTPVATTWISGFCMLINPDFWDSLDGSDFFDERFVNGCEDNHVCIRAIYSGWSLSFAADVFIWHEGSVSLKQEGDESQGTHAYLNYLNICKDEIVPEARVGVGYRVKLVTQEHIELFRRSIASVADWADLVAVVDNDSNFSVDDILSEFPDTKFTVYKTKGHDEPRDRQMCLDICREAGMTWYFSIDADEVLETKVDKAYIDRLTNPPRPDIIGYGVHWYTFWDEACQFVRADSTFALMAGPRLVRILPGYNMLSPASGLHMGNVPCIGLHGGFRVSSMRIKHYGYNTQEERERKYEFYERTDKVKSRAEIGYDNYDHLIASTVAMSRWKEDSTIAIGTMVFNEERNLQNWLNMYWAFADALVFCDTGSDDGTIEVLKFYGATVVDFEERTGNAWDYERPDFGAARNVVLDMARESGSTWYWQIDCDESPRPSEDNHDPLAKVRRMVDNADVDGYQFLFRNLNKNDTHTVSTTTRLMRLSRPFEYTGTTHETVDHAVKEHSLRVGRAPVEMVHTGWLISDDKAKAKLKRYLRGNLRMIQEHADDARGWCNSAMHLLDIKATRTATMFLHQALQRNNKFSAPRRELMSLAIEQLKIEAEVLSKNTPNDDPLSEYTNAVLTWCTEMAIDRDSFIRHPEHVTEVLQEPEFEWVVALIDKHDPHLIGGDKSSGDSEQPGRIPDASTVIS